MSSHLETLILMRAWGATKTGSAGKHENWLGSSRWLISFFGATGKTFKNSHQLIS